MRNKKLSQLKLHRLHGVRRVAHFLPHFTFQLNRIKDSILGKNISDEGIHNGKTEFLQRIRKIWISQSRAKRAQKSDKNYVKIVNLTNGPSLSLLVSVKEEIFPIRIK